MSSDNPWPDYLARAAAWHETYGDRGQWWPAGSATVEVVAPVRPRTLAAKRRRVKWLEQQRAVPA